MPIVFNVIISGISVSGDLSTLRNHLSIDLGNSDRIGVAKFALQNNTGTRSATLFSGNSTVEIDAILASGIAIPIFTGTIEEAYPVVDTRQGMETDYVAYDYAQELLGLISPDARLPSLIDNTTGGISVVNGDQGMGVQTGMDLVLFVSGIISAAGGSILSGAQLNLFMSQYFGKSGDTTGSNSGQAFSFKPYTSGMRTSGTNTFYRTWYAQDGASDTNANYWIPFDRLKVRHEVAWDVLRKITRQGRVVDRSGFKVQFETYINSSGAIILRTSGTSDFVASGVSLIYYQAGKSGSANNNIKSIRRLPWDTTAVKNYIIGWFPIWSQYPFTDDWSDLVGYSGGFWSGGNQQQGLAASVVLSGSAPAPGAPGFISIRGTNYSGLRAGLGTGGFDLIFTLWSGYTINIQKWNVSGGNGVNLGYAFQPSISGTASATWFNNVRIFDSSGNFIIESGSAGSINEIPNNQVKNSGWSQVQRVIYTASGTFLSGDGTNGWAAGAGGFPDLTRIKQIGIGFGGIVTIGTVDISCQVDNLNFGFSYNFNPVTAFNSGSISVYRKRYEEFEFPYQVTDSGAADVVLSELQSRMLSRQLAEFTIKDNPNVNPAQLNITPGQAFVLDAPLLAAGSGQFYYYFVATEVRHEWSTDTGFETFVKAYPWFSGQTVGSGQNLINAILPLPIPLPRPGMAQPNTHFWQIPNASKAGVG